MSWLRTRCLACGHLWNAVQLPMELGRISKLLAGLHCPACGAGAKQIVTAPAGAQEPRYQWRFWQPAPCLGKRGRWGKWHDCTRAEYERADNNVGTEKRVLP